MNAHTITFRARWMALRPFRRHSMVLLVAGAVYLIIGISYIVTGTTENGRDVLSLALTLAPLSVWGSMFIAVGTLAVISSRWPPASETWGYSALSLISTLWAMFYACGLVLGGPGIGVRGVVQWLLIAFLWWAISGLRNPQDLPAPATAGGDE